ncbi:MAG: glycosyltransferase family 4 protein [Pseudomonadota bacterium]
MRPVTSSEPSPGPEDPNELLDGDPMEEKADRGHGSPAGDLQAGEPTTVHARRRVLLVAPQAFFSISGTPINIYNMCKVLTEIGYEVHLATLPLGETIAMPGLVYHRVAKVPGLNSVPIGFSFAKLVYDLLLAVKVIRLLRRQRFAVIHSIEDAVFFTAPIAHRFQTPTISDLDSDICGQLANNAWLLVRCMAYLARPLRRLALRRSTCALTVADSLTRLVHAESPKTRVFEVKDIPGEKLLRTADPEATERLRQELDLPKTGLIVYTGNFDWRQGVETLIEAMPLVVAQHPNSLLLLVGGEPRKIAHMRQMAKRLGVEDAVRLIGKRPIDEMPEFMAMASVLASPRLEPYVTPLKIYGYMASGRPIVATDLPTHTDVLDLNSSILAPPDAPGLADGIVRALNEPARSDRLGLRAKQLVEREHTYESFKAKLADAYNYVVAVGGAGGLRTSRD